MLFPKMINLKKVNFQRVTRSSQCAGGQLGPGGIAWGRWVAGALVTQTRLFVAAKATHETTIFLKSFVSVI